MKGPRESAEQFGLIDGLAGPAVLKRGRAVCGEQKKGGAGVIGLNYWGKPVGGSRAGRATPWT